MPESSQNLLNDFEDSLQKLENIVSKMEQGELTLEQSLNAFEQGVKLTRNCQESLKQAEQRVSQLMHNGEQLELDRHNSPNES